MEKCVLAETKERSKGQKEEPMLKEVRSEEGKHMVRRVQEGSIQEENA